MGTQTSSPIAEAHANQMLLLALASSPCSFSPGSAPFTASPVKLSSPVKLQEASVIQDAKLPGDYGFGLCSLRRLPSASRQT